MSERPEEDSSPADTGSRSNFWRLHVPLALVMTLCTVATVIEAQRAMQGVGRAWIYTFEWPIIALFAVWIWNRYRKEDNVRNMGNGIADRWRQRIDQLNAEADRSTADRPPVADLRAPTGPPSATADDADADAELTAWQAYLRRLNQPTGTPPTDR